MENEEITKEEYLKAFAVVEDYHEQIIRKISEAKALSNENRPMVYKGDVIMIIERKPHIRNKQLTVGSQHIVSSEKAFMSRGTKFSSSTLVFKCRGGLSVNGNYSYKIVKRKAEV